MAYLKGDGKNVVIALGGNALGNTPQEQLELVKNTAGHIVDMVAEGINVVVSHGNGPQVGMINNAFERAFAQGDADLVCANVADAASVANAASSLGAATGIARSGFVVSS